jgi:hypothetical protein
MGKAGMACEGTATIRALGFVDEGLAAGFASPDAAGLAAAEPLAAGLAAAAPLAVGLASPEAAGLAEAALAAGLAAEAGAVEGGALGTAAEPQAVRARARERTVATSFIVFLMTR